MNMDLYNHGTLGVASDEYTVSLGKVRGTLEGWDPLLTTETKYGLLWFWNSAHTHIYTHPPSSPVQQNSGKRQHSAGEIQTLLIRALWKYSTGCCKKNWSALSY